MDPSELKIIIEKSKEIYQASKNHKQRTKPEESVFKFARGSIVADQDLPVGKIINANDIWARRPGTGEIPASEFDNLIGRKLKKSICFNQQIKWEDLANE